MKSVLGSILTLAFLVVVGCTKDALTIETPPKNVRFTAIGENAAHIYQFDVRSGLESGILTDLTETIGVLPGYLTLREVGDVLTFFSFAGGNFSARQWDVDSGTKTLLEDFYTNSEDRAITWGANSEEHLFLGYYIPKGSKNFGVRTIDSQTGSGRDLFIENNILEAYQPLYHNDKLFVTFLDGNSEYHIAIIAPSSNTLLVDLQFGEFSPSILINENGDIVIIKSRQGREHSYGVYDFNTYVTLQEGSFDLQRSFSAGFLNSPFLEGKLYYQNLYVQPSTLIFSPAIYDFESKTNTIIDLVGIIAAYQDEQQTRIFPISQGYDPDSGSFLIGYGNTENLDQLVGGVMVISENGVLVDTIDLPFIPTYFMNTTH